MGWINNLNEGKLKEVANKPHYRPVVDAIEKVQHDGVEPKAVIDEAIKATKDQYVKENRELDPEEIRKDAFLAASSASVEVPYELKGLPAGSDKTKHYFVSGTIASQIDETLESIKVPKGIRQKIAIGATVTLGWLKEVTDIFSSGFNKDDLKADKSGAKIPFQEES